MWHNAEKIVAKLKAAGHVAYFAGGAVRDLLLDRQIHDIDIATDATPSEIEKLFPRTHPIGREFGVVLVMVNRHAFEVATFRGESEYDGRRPGKVFWANAETDARRRDFTVNGLFYDPLKKQVLDFVNGQHDLKLRVIRAIGSAEARIREDHLRLLRAVRFRNILNFEYEPKTAAALHENVQLITRISGERIRDELVKMLADPSRVNSIRDLADFELLEILLPELTRLKNLEQPREFHTEGDAYTHSLASLASLPKKIDPNIALAVLFHDLGKAETFGRKENGRITFFGHAHASAKLAAKILTRLRLDNASRAKIGWLIENHMALGDLTKMRVAKRHRYFTHPWFPDLLKVFRADILGTRPTDLSLLREVQKMWRAETHAKLLAPPRELLTGVEIMHTLHLKAGPEIGRLKRVLFDAQVEGIVKTREEAVRFLEKCLKR